MAGVKRSAVRTSSAGLGAAVTVAPSTRASPPAPPQALSPSASSRLSALIEQRVIEAIEAAFAGQVLAPDRSCAAEPRGQIGARARIGRAREEGGDLAVVFIAQHRAGRID